MRNEAEMMELILETARQDERIRAVCLNGSRVNFNVPPDRFQDYDIVYLVRELSSFLEDDGWIDRFGERVILQMPERMHLIPPDNNRQFPYLMLFEDENRIDLRLIPVEQAMDYVREDKLTKVLLDKDDMLPPLPEPTDEDYRVKQPDAKLFADCCNEFWWVSPYVAKGLWRGELLYALDHLNGPVREMLMGMLNWQAGYRTDFSVSTGKNGKYLDRYLPQESWQALLSTYPAAEPRSIQLALRAMADLFSTTAQTVAEKLDCHYNAEEELRVRRYLDRVFQDAEQEERLGEG
ncbi:aminoglycoside 6-adenylyltransferase [Paenibacillus herberti]|uniref:Aminoglycoside adenylyltransferase n=1 Tax=Paenibacillus herberti TaxID=1619309 RepID=A0A229NU52_9BACL|nr:aminoglycoside 6-adenylyltransferase [Paenibacillus herberti]OXM13413.1 aminoglycoside adenylyltransferase [Paenibacillus herberti]